MIALDNDLAVVRLNPSRSCKGCGAAAMGLCNPSGSVPVMTVKNTKRAVTGDTVTLTLDSSTRRKGFLLAYFIPVASLLAGSILGFALKNALAVSSLDVITGFTSFLIASALTFPRLKKLNTSSFLTIKGIVGKYNFNYGSSEQTDSCQSVSNAGEPSDGFRMPEHLIS